MSLKAELQTWAAALQCYDEENLEQALDMFSSIADSSKILTNIGLIHATLGEHEAAVEQFIAATQLDQYLAVAYFQCGVSNFLLGRYELALKDFEEALLYLRGNQAINYEQLGLKFKLFSAEVLFNKGLSLIYMGNVEEGLADMEEARREKATDEHGVIDDAIADRGEGYTVFSIPVGVLYRPSENKLKNSRAKDYMGKARLVAAADPADAFTEFTGVNRLRNGLTPSGTIIRKPMDDDAPTLGRSVTIPTPRNNLDPIAGPGLGRSKTTLNVPADARERIAGLSAGGPPAEGNGGGSGGSMGVREAEMGGPVRGLSVRKNSPTGGRPPVLPEKEQGQAGTRLTEFYDDYFDVGEEEVPPLPTQTSSNKQDKISAWARANANPASAMPRSQSRSAPPSTYAPSSYGGGSMGRRKLTRRTTRRTAPLSMYDEEEEGYGSGGEYDDGPFELVKIRVKLHYQDDVRGMALTPETPYEEFVDRVTAKFNKPLDGLVLRFQDEDGGKVSLRDDSDYELAIETAREHARGKPEGKLEVWCQDR
jgi:tetratricopeptide (TPR) repeat protein